jgi:AbiV family abortive infection protein
MRKRKIPRSIPTDPLLSFGQAAIANALAIAEDARLLAASGRWSRATALMVIAREEGGKGVYALASGLKAALDADSQQRGQEPLIKILLRMHERKQAFSAVLDAAMAASAGCPLLRAYAPILANIGIDATGSGGDKAMTEQTPLTLNDLQPDEACVERVVKAAFGAYEAETVAGHSEALRQRALYVDISQDGQRVSIPAEVLEDSYRGQEKSFRHAERVLRAFDSAQLTPEALAMMRAQVAKQREQVQAENRALRAGEQR